MTRRGLTLFEMLLAIALVTTLVGAMFGFLFDLVATRARVLDVTARSRVAETLVDRVERDLATCLVGDAASGPGVVGDETSLTILTRSVPVALAVAPGGGDAWLGDLERAEYRFDPGSGSIELRRGTSGASGGPANMGAAIGRVRFRYYDGAAWHARFDSLARGRLPVAVEVAVWLEPGADKASELDPEPIPEPAPPGDDGEPEESGDEATALAPSEFEEEGPSPDRLRLIAVTDAAGEPASADGGTEERGP